MKYITSLSSCFPNLKYYSTYLDNRDYDDVADAVTQDCLEFSRDSNIINQDNLLDNIIYKLLIKQKLLKKTKTTTKV